MASNLFPLLLLLVFWAKNTSATKDGCWDSFTQAVASSHLNGSSVPNGVYCQTKLDTGVTTEEVTCDVDSNTLCTVITDTVGNGGTGISNKITSCNNPQTSGSESCIADTDYACAINRYTGQGVCVGLLGTTTGVTFASLTKENWLFYNKANAVVKCYNRNNQTNPELSCNSTTWSCQTNLLTGVDSCATYPADYPSTSKNFHCVGTNSKPDKCNDWANSGIECWNPQKNEEVACSSNTWQCKTEISTGIGSCTGELNLVNSSSIFVCTGHRCNKWDTFTCWNPQANSYTSSCQSYHWQCKTDLSTGVGSCAQAGYTSATEFYCTFPNCNNFGPVSPTSLTAKPGVGWTCFDPSTATITACSSSQWRCQTTTAGVGSCTGAVVSTSYYTCATTPNCNLITSCYDFSRSESVTCASPYSTRACQKTALHGIGWLGSSATTGGCATSCGSDLLVPESGQTSCCYYNNCNLYLTLSASTWNGWWASSNAQEIKSKITNLKILLGSLFALLKYFN